MSRSGSVHFIVLPSDLMLITFQSQLSCIQPSLSCRRAVCIQNTIMQTGFAIATVNLHVKIPIAKTCCSARIVKYENKYICFLTARSN